MFNRFRSEQVNHISGSINFKKFSMFIPQCKIIIIIFSRQLHVFLCDWSIF